MISVILYGRNDSHGYNLPKRAALSLNCIAEVLTHADDEIIFVDCNTPDDMPTFPESIADTLTPKAKQLLRILRLRPSQYEKGKNGTKFKVLEPLCRNVAIRRSNPKNRWILNTNTDMVFVPLKNGSLSDVCASLRDGFYELPRFEVPEMLWESTDRLNPTAIIHAFHRWGTRLHINEVVSNTPEILFDGPGDFQLALREQMFAIHGMNEQMVLGWHVDSNLCKRLFLVNGKTEHLLDEVYAYHCDHTRLNTVYHNTKDSTSNDWMKFVKRVSSPQIPEQAGTWGLPEENIEEISLTDEPAARYIRLMEAMLPGMRQPMLRSALTAEAWNHGLLYDISHVLPYLADHISVIPPQVHVGYVGANVELVAGIAQFRRQFGHSGKILLNEQILCLGGGIPAELAELCEFASIDDVYQRAGLICIDLWQGNFPTVRNSAGYSIPAPSLNQGRFAAAIVRVFLEFAKREKNDLVALAPTTRKFLFVGTHNTWFESATVQLFSMVLTPYSTYVRHGFIRTDAFDQPWRPLPISDLIVKTSLPAMIAAISAQTCTAVKEIDFLLAQLFASEMSLTASGTLPDCADIAALVAPEVLLETIRLGQLEFTVAGQLERADRLEEVEASWDDLFPKLVAKYPVAQLPTRYPAKSEVRRVLVDASTFSNRGSMDRGVGHYTRHHLLALAKAAPEIEFILTSAGKKPPEDAAELLTLPNVTHRKLADCQSQDFDLYHVPDPMTAPADETNTLDLFPELPMSAVFYDLTPLRFYYSSLNSRERMHYLMRLLTLSRRQATLLSISDYTRTDLVRSNFISPERIFPIYAGLNEAPKPSRPLSPEEERRVLQKHGIDRPFFLHVGALERHKNFLSVLSAFGNSGRTDRSQLVVVGRKEGALAITAEQVQQTRLRNLVVFTDFIPRGDLEVLYAHARALLFMSYSEGFGFPVLEAMARGCPVICSNTTSLPEVAGNAALTLAPDDIAGIAESMCRLMDDELLRQKLRSRGRTQAAKFPWSMPARKTLEAWRGNNERETEKASLRAEAPRQSKRVAPPPKITKISPGMLPTQLGTAARQLPTTESPAIQSPTVSVDWHGSFFDHGSLSTVNRALTAALVQQRGVNISRVSPTIPAGATELGFAALVEQVRSRASVRTDITVRHQWPPDWSRPAHGALVVMQPWEFGSLPKDWVAQATHVDEFWAYTDYVRQVYISSGVDPAKVKVVPLGIDASIFRPGIAPTTLATAKRFKFLFVGGTIHRKGPDILLATYLKTFTAADDVCLVIKDFGGNSVYAGQTLGAKIKAAQALPNAPEILHLTQEIAPDAVPSLYAACDCLVHPYRGEGFGLPILEAMACGLPVIVTAGGSADDFATDEFAYRIPAVRKPIGDSVGGLKLAGDGWLLEPDAAALAERMKWVLAHHSDAQDLGARTSNHIRENWTWERSAQLAANNLQQLVARRAVDSSSATPRPLPLRKPAMAPVPTVTQLGDLTKAQDLLRKKSPRTAWESTRQAIQERPFHPEAWLLLAEIARMTGDGASTKRCAQQAAHLAPSLKATKKLLNKDTKGATKPDWLVLPDMVSAEGPPRAPRLSVCLIAKNEEKFLGRCLASVKGLADQIVVVDTGSTDRTVEIAREHGAEVHTFTWCDDFSAARNAALEHATGDWILVLDADEELPAASHEKLRAHLRDAAVMAWRLPIVDVGREEAGHSYVPRLFRNAPGVFFAGRVHEHAFGVIEQLRKAWGLDNRLGEAVIVHHGYTNAVTEARDKVARNLRLLEMALQESPNNVSLLMSLGLELCRSKRSDEGLLRYFEAFNLLAAQPASAVVPELRETLLTQFASYLFSVKRHSDVVKILTSPLARQVKLTANQCYVLGMAQIEQEAYADAAEQLRQCLARRAERSLMPALPEVRSSAPRRALALCLWRLKEPEAADKEFQQALAEEPQGASVHTEYARFLSDTGLLGDALQLLHKLVSEKPDLASVWSCGAQLALTQPDLLDIALDWTSVAIQHHGESPEIVGQRAEVLMLASQFEAALPLWRKLAEHDSSRAQAAVILCEAALQQPSAAVGLSPAVDQEFARWFQRLVDFKAEAAIVQLLNQAGEVSRVLPTAGGILKEIAREFAATKATPPASG